MEAENDRSAATPPILRPGDDGWDTARQAWNLAADQHPAAIAQAGSAAAVAGAVRAARGAGLRIAPQATGHGAVALGDLADTMLLRTAGMNAVEVDAERRVARVGAGAQWGDVVAPAAAHGLTALHGSSPTVGVAGYTLGGGIGWFSRRHGLACNSVTSIELVDAAGEQRRVDADNDPDLFWALRGGGGFAVVTAIEFELIPLREAFAGLVAWPAERGEEVLDAWRAWSATAPEEMASSFRWLQLPPLPDVPEPLRGRRTVAITAACCGDPAEGEALLAPLRALPGAVLDVFGVMPAPALCRLNGDPEDPAPAIGHQALMKELGDDAAAALCEVAGPDAGGPLGVVELRHLGGALARAPVGAGALARLDGEFVLFALGILMDPAMAPAARSALDTTIAAVQPWSNGSYLNFADTVVPTETGFDAETWARLRAVKAALDPDDAIRSNHPVEPA